MEIKEISYSDGSKSKISVFSSQQGVSTTLICLPAMGIRAKYYEMFADHLCSAGFNVITADWRGLGHSSKRASYKTDFGYEDFISDVKKLVELADDWFPNSKKIIIGHSLGGQIGSLFSAKFSSSISGLILITSCSVYHKGWANLTALKLKYARWTFLPISKIFGYFPGDKLGFAGKEARSVIKDWSYNARYGKYKLTNSDYDYEKALKLFDKPVISISVEGDVLASRKAVENLYNKFNPKSEISHFHLNSEETGISPLNHFTWAKNPDYFVGLIKNWVDQQMNIKPVDIYVP